MKISMIVAMAQNNVIGTKGALPWYIPEDLKKFREITTNHPILMGRKTFESLPRVLPNRDHFIITRNADYKMTNSVARDSEHVFVASTPSEAIAIILDRQCSDEGKSNILYDEAFVIGGGEIYNQMMPMADRLYITYVKENVTGDTYFPEIDFAIWKEVDRKLFDKFDFVVYDRNDP